MTVESRRARILEAARRDGDVSVDALAVELAVSAHTIRRDINGLCEAGRLRRLHGGAQYLDAGENLPYRTRAVMNAPAKRAIAACVAELVPDGATIFVSIGTTPALVAAALACREGLTVVTNNLNAANALAENASNRIVLPGGELRLPDRDFLGPAAAEIFEAWRADVGIYGVGGIERDGTLLDFHEPEIRARERIRQNSRQALLVADASKFGRRATAVGGRLADADLVVVDRLPGPPFQGLLEAMGGRVIVAEAAAAGAADAGAADAGIVTASAAARLPADV